MLDRRLGGLKGCKIFNPDYITNELVIHVHAFYINLAYNNYVKKFTNLKLKETIYKCVALNHS